MRIKPEIMSPAGYYPQLHAAIEAGADAVYFGLNHFTARAKVGFTLAELPDVMQTLHRRGVKGYVTFNTLIFENELPDAVKAIEAIAKAGADSVIVQDVGMAQLAHQIAPTLNIHGSTQMSITSAEGVHLAQRFGVNRVVLARELSLDDMRQIREQTDCELEIFVHGALCVSYSGQCFSSEAWGGRSANRGQCAQACRLPYDLIVDEQLRPLGDKRYLLSPGDLYAIHQVPDIIDVGIHTLKIEGRYKDEQYVALTTSAYRRAVDAAWEAQPDPITAEDDIQLEQVYSRGLGSYFISGTNHQQVVDGRAPRHRGVLVGRVQQISADYVRIIPTGTQDIAPLKAGDGLVFDAADWRSPEQAEEGGHIYEIEPIGDLLELKFGNNAINFARIRKGDWVWRSSDADILKSAKPFLNATTPVHQQAINASIFAHEGQMLSIHWQLAKDPAIQTTVIHDEPLGRANKRPVTADYLHQQLGRLGNTAYRLDTLDADIGGQPFIPSSVLNRLRQEAMEDLAAQQASSKQVETHAPLDVLESARGSITHDIAQTDSIALHLLVRTPEQLEAALELNPASITLDYLELYGLRPAVERVKDAGITVRVASPRILKPQEQRIVNFLLRLDCDLLVRSGGLLEAYRANILTSSSGTLASTSPTNYQQTHFLSWACKPLHQRTTSTPCKFASSRRTSAGIGWKSSPIIICPCSILSIVYSVGLCQMAQAIKTVVNPARNTKSRYVTTKDASIPSWQMWGVVIRYLAQKHKSPAHTSTACVLVASSTTAWNLCTKQRGMYGGLSRHFRITSPTQSIARRSTNA
jgi:putative protease